MIDNNGLHANPNNLTKRVKRALTSPRNPIYNYKHANYIRTVTSNHNVTATTRKRLTNTGTGAVFAHTKRNSRRTRRLVRHSTHALTELVTSVGTAASYRYIIINNDINLTRKCLTLIRACLTRRPTTFRISLLTTRCHRSTNLLKTTLLTRKRVL